MKEQKMSKIHNMIRTIGQPGSEEFDLPKGWQLDKVVYLGAASPSEVAAGFYKVLYVLVPEVVLPEPLVYQHGESGNTEVVKKAGRPPKVEA
jgi:hypothetical protein